MVSIRRSDNSRLVGRWPDIQERRNNEAKHIPPQQHIEKGVGDGVVRYMGKTDGVDRIFAFHKIPTYPFYVLIGRAVHEQFAEWYKIAVTTVLLTFLALLLIGFFLHSLTKRQSSLQKSEAQYQAIVENQHDAVCRWLPETTLLTFANEIIKEAVTMLRASLPTTITIEQDIAPDAGVILADPTQLHQILMNLGTNAFHAMEMAGGILSISLHQKTLSERDLGLEKHMQPGNYIQLAVRDSGVGIAPEIRGKIFDPYFTTKAAGKGTGMGLAMVHGIVQSYGGSITCDSQVGEGTVFHITLPVAEAGSIKEKECTELIPVGREHILLIDDEQMLAEMSKAMLERLGYRVTSEKNSIEALVTFRKQPQLFNLMITDQTMPGMTGIDLARLMLQIRPGLPIILCTGYSTLIAEEKAKSLGINGFALKPVTKEGLGTLVRRVLDGDTITG